MIIVFYKSLFILRNLWIWDFFKEILFLSQSFITHHFSEISKNHFISNHGEWGVTLLAFSPSTPASLKQFDHGLLTTTLFNQILVKLSSVCLLLQVNLFPLHSKSNKILSYKAPLYFSILIFPYSLPPVSRIDREFHWITNYTPCNLVR